MNEKLFYTYLIRCEDNSLYCGYTSDIIRRVEEHRNGIGSKYVRAHKFKKLEVFFTLKSKSLAMRLESRIKKLSKYKKEKIVLKDVEIIGKLGVEYIDIFS